MFNKVFILGNLTRDPELRYTPGGTAVCHIGIATNRKGKENKVETFFGEIIAFGKLAEHCKEYLSKGSKLFVEGRLVTEAWEKDGKSHTKTRIIAESTKFLDFKKKDSEAAGSEETYPGEPF